MRRLENRTNYTTPSGYIMSPEPKTLLLTGAGGAIGCHVLSHFLKNTDWNIIATDSFRHKGYFDRITEVTNDKSITDDDIERLRLFTHDLTAPFTEREIKQMGRIDYIINLASLSDVQASIEDPVTFVKNNTDIALNMLELARKIRPEKFIQFSTDEVYGPAPKDGGGHREWDAIIPSNPYSASKAAQEALAIAWWRCYGVPVIITNTMNNFGEMQAPTKFPALIQKRIQNDETIQVHSAASGDVGTRYYLHSSATADALRFILDNIAVVAHTPGEIDRPLRLNIVGDLQVSNLDLVHTIARLMGKEAKVEMVNFHETNLGHDLHYGLNGDLLASLGWTSPTTFGKSMKETIEWQRTHKEWI